MPKTSFQFEIATVKTAVAVFAEPFIAKPITKFLRKKGLVIKSKPTIKKSTVDYVIDSFGSREAISLAQKQGSKYLRIIIGPHLSPPLEKVNWRTIRTDFLVGPRIPATTILGELITSSVKNEVLTLPSVTSEKAYLLHLEDLAEAVWQALVLPNTSGKEFLVLGQEVALNKLATSLQQLGQTTKGFNFSPEKKIPSYPPAEIQQTRQLLKWQPKIEWQEALEQTFRYFWKKLKPEDLTASHQDKATKPRFYLVEEPPEIKPEIKKEENIIGPRPEEKEKKKEVKEPLEKEEEMIVIEEDSEKSQEKEPEEEKISSKVKELLSQIETTEKEEPKKPFRAKQQKAVSPPLKWWQIVILALFSLFLIEFSVWLKPITALVSAGWQIKGALNHFRLQSWAESQKSAKKAKVNLTRAEESFKNNPLKFLFFGADHPLAQITEAGNKIAQAAEIAIPLTENSLNLVESIFKGQRFNLEGGIQQIQSQEKQLIAQLSLVEALLRGNWYLPPRWKNIPDQLAKNVNQLTTSLTKMQKIIDHLSWITGAQNQKRVFLILMQNNMELRPTGGFIGSFALLTFEDGSLTNFEVKDVYAADGQLKGHVEPPKEIKEILGEANWYLRDSNWDPDFPKSARNAEWFLKKELGQEVDGVIGFNLEAAKKMIAAFGEIYLPDFNEKISADNLFERAEFWAENEFFPGSNQKTAFLGLLGQQLFESIKAAKAENQLKVGQALLNSLDEKEISFSVHNLKLASTFRQLGWDGSIREPKCTLKNCLTDYLYLVEANLGVNKANYFIRRGLEQAINFTKDGKVEHRLKINYENNATSNNWPGGKYLNWLRIYLPKGSELTEIVIYDPLNPQDRKVVNSEERREEAAGEKMIVGFEVTVPIKQRRTVEITFGQKVNLESDQLGYLLYWQKQSGYRETPISLLISFPDDWQPLQVNPAADLISGKLLFNKQLDRDLTFGVEFAK